MWVNEAIAELKVQDAGGKSVLYTATDIMYGMKCGYTVMMPYVYHTRVDVDASYDVSIRVYVVMSYMLYVISAS
jgi:hypothetical protein